MLLVSSYNGFGVHTLLSILRYFPGLYKQFIFVSVAVVDSGSFKGKEEIEALQHHTAAGPGEVRRQDAADGLRRRLASGTSASRSSPRPRSSASRSPGSTPRRRSSPASWSSAQERFYHGFLHNETARAIQRRLQWVGVPMVVLPIRARV